MGKQRKIAVLLNGSIKNDSRVIKICKSLTLIADVHLFYSNGVDQDSEIFNNFNVYLHSITPPNNLMIKLIKHTFFYNEYNYYYEYVINTNQKFDIIYANDFPTLNVAVKLKENYRTKLIYDSHEIYLETLNQFYDIETFRFPKNIILQFSLQIMRISGKRKEKELVKSVDYMLTVNELIRDYFIVKYNPKSIGFLYNAPLINISNNIVPTIRELTKWESKDIILLYQGVLNKGRGIEIFFDSFKDIKNSRIKLLVIGSGALLSVLKKKVRKNNLEDRIKFLGFVQENLLHSYTKQADYSIFFLETFNLNTQLASPNKIFQYIHAEVPVITNYTIENDKIFNKYKIGYQTELSKQAIANIIDYAAENTNSRELFISECQKAKMVLNWEKQEQKLLQIVKELLLN